MSTHEVSPAFTLPPPVVYVTTERLPAVDDGRVSSAVHQHGTGASRGDAGSLTGKSHSLRRPSRGGSPSRARCAARARARRGGGAPARSWSCAPIRRALPPAARYALAARRRRRPDRSGSASSSDHRTRARREVDPPVADAQQPVVVEPGALGGPGAPAQRAGTAAGARRDRAAGAPSPRGRPSPRAAPRPAPTSRMRGVPASASSSRT